MATTSRRGTTLTKEHLADELRRCFPHGHPRFVELIAKALQLHDLKNHDYAKGGKPTGNFDRVAAILKLYPNFPYDHPAGVAAVYMLKQLDALLWGMSRRIEHKVEGTLGRTQDLGVYPHLIQINLEETPLEARE